MARPGTVMVSENTRKLAVDLEQTRVRLLEYKSVLEPLKLELLEQDLELKSMESLAKKGLTAQLDLEAKRIKVLKLRSKVKEQHVLVQQAELDVKKGSVRLGSFEEEHQGSQHATLSSTLQVLKKAIEVEEKKLEEIVLLSRDLVLKSPVNGTVHNVCAGVGDVVLRGNEIFTLVETNPRHVIAYAPLEKLRDVCPGEDVSLIRFQADSQIMTCKIMQVSRSIDEITPRLQKHPDIVEWGIPFLVQIPKGVHLLPGELVGINQL